MTAPEKQVNDQLCCMEILVEPPITAGQIATWSKWLLSVLVTVRSRWSDIRRVRRFFIKWRCSCSASWRLGTIERLRNAWDRMSRVHMVSPGNREDPSRLTKASE